MVRFITGISLLIFVITVSGDDVMDPMEVALAATEDATTSIQEPANNGDSGGSQRSIVTLVELPEPNRVGAISDSISNVTVEENIDISNSEASPGDNENPDDEDTSASTAPSGSEPSSDSSQVTPAIVLASLTALAITGLFV
ncbi:uncharacterized protein PHALS_01524 [Plasmopara halstedii]|uniref:RxLR-like protein n=1 Tax=Plasmopara halstedii TaxID=4781 RepID=A0A0N7L6U0_PLAHL|nr:uncharacterized protein PHALS_01524 [Plasmopara halstedii]CEG45211.1 hypothetical protein PHALS_01524 [Plasmopara halstedii]|eukprot:XP_024581580.1 hypothetical protein PHALS_01524 [Plasmopara halstedii]